MDIGISGAMTALNYFINFSDACEANYQLGFIVRFNGGKKMPSECIECRACMEACPQNIDIMNCFSGSRRRLSAWTPSGAHVTVGAYVSIWRNRHEGASRGSFPFIRLAHLSVYDA